MYVLAIGPLPSASKNDDASTGLVPGLKLTKMQVRTFWTAPKELGFPRHFVVSAISQPIELKFFLVTL